MGQQLLPRSEFRLCHDVLQIEPLFLHDKSPNADMDAFSTYVLEFNGNCFASMEAVLGHGPEAEVVRATWRAVFLDGHGSGQVILSSPVIDHCKLGDLVVFILAELPLYMEGRLLGLCACILSQFGTWLERSIARLSPPSCVVNIPKLMGLVRSRNLDNMQLSHLASAMASGQLANQTQSKKEFGQMKQQHKVMVYTYTKSFAKLLKLAESQTLHILGDGWRSVGEQMDLFCAYSPYANIVGMLPFQVLLCLCGGVICRCLNVMCVPWLQDCLNKVCKLVKQAMQPVASGQQPIIGQSGSRARSDPC